MVSAAEIEGYLFPLWNTNSQTQLQRFDKQQWIRLLAKDFHETAFLIGKKNCKSISDACITIS
jgi:hypothetical protein